MYDDNGDPIGWSDTAKSITKNKYCRDGETIQDLIDRVVGTLLAESITHKYFDTIEEAEAWANRLEQHILNQEFSFNSPVWFNLGVTNAPQCSACFILSVEDSMDSIQEWWKNEGTIFRGGSGAGVNLSALRGSSESIAGKGTSSGPVSFMRAADSIAGSIKSGGKTRRAAKMVILNADHPDVEEFIWCKAKEERKAYALRNVGFDTGINGDSGHSIQFQNANNSVRVSDAFMQAVEQDEDWELRARTTGKVLKTVKARQLFKQIAQAAWECGDPGLQFDDTINAWNTCASIGRINASNPCSEYMHLDNTACNLASLNLIKFKELSGFQWDKFAEVIDDIITAMDLIITISSYPTPEIAKNVKEMRQLGLGYTNLGAFLVGQGVAYDSEEALSWAREITRFMTRVAYYKSVELAKKLGPYTRFEETRSDMLRVLKSHRYGAVAKEAEKYGIRNSQISVIAPTGTISFMMDCDTTGIEPMIALKSEKTLVGGGKLSMVPKCVIQGLRALGYDEGTIDILMENLDQPSWSLRVKNAKDQAVFATALGGQGVPAIEPMAHIRMMAAVQPYISGAISKTVNMPTESTVEDVEELYMEAWKLGLKSIAIYRDNSKAVQPVKRIEAIGEGLDSNRLREIMRDIPPMGGTFTFNLAQEKMDEFYKTREKLSPRRRLPATRNSVTHRFQIGEHVGYLTVGEYDDTKQPGEIFLTMAKEGSTLSGLLDAFATAVSLLLQNGVPLRDLVQKFKHYRFEPAGWTGNPEVPSATSIIDYVFRWLEVRYQAGLAELVDAPVLETGESNLMGVQVPHSAPPFTADAVRDDVVCYNCGQLMQRAGSCMVCPSCGETTGCG